MIEEANVIGSIVERWTVATEPCDNSGFAGGVSAGLDPSARQSHKGRTVTAQKSQENWPGTIKAIGLKALTTGRFWQFCFLLIILAFAQRIESSDWVRIAELFLGSDLIRTLGWGLLGISIGVSIGIFQIQRTIYKKEIARLVDHRNDLQKQLARQPFASSVAEEDATPPSPKRLGNEPQ